MIEGNKVSLRPIEDTDLSKIVEWRNHREIRKKFFSRSLLSNSGQKNWFAGYLQDSSKEIYIGTLKSKETPIGMIGLYNIDYKNHKAEIGSTIVDPSMWGKGIGTEMIALLIDYAFVDLSLNRIYAYAFANNYQSIQAKEKCGFKIEGKLIEDYYGDGQYEDVVLLGITRNQWEQR